MVGLLIISSHDPIRNTLSTSINNVAKDKIRAFKGFNYTQTYIYSNKILGLISSVIQDDY